MEWLEKSYPTACLRKRHGSVYSKAGDPDLYFLLDGTHVECELKQVGQEPTQLQRARLAQWARAGALCWVAHSLAEFQSQMQAAFGPPLPGPSSTPPSRRAA